MASDLVVSIWIMDQNLMYTVLGFLGSFLAGWFIATSKHREEIFKNKLIAYKEINAVASKIIILSKPSSNESDKGNEYIALKLELFESLLKNVIFISADVNGEVLNLIAKDINENHYKCYAQIASFMMCELKTGHAIAIDETLLYLPFDIKDGLIKPKNKSKE